MQVKNSTNSIYPKKIAFTGIKTKNLNAIKNNALITNPIQDKLEINFSRNIIHQALAKGLLNFYQFIEGYGQSTSKTLDKLLKDKHISTKEILLYIIGGGITFSALRNVNSIDELDKNNKKQLLKNLLNLHQESIGVNRYFLPEYKELFPFKVLTKKTEQKLLKNMPLLPKNEVEYANLFNDLTKSLEITHKPLNSDELKTFNSSLENLGQSLTKITDPEFAKIKITQEYSNNDFIKDVLETTKNLNKNEKIKLLSQYEFNIVHNPAKTNFPFSIEGYPKLQESPINTQLDKLVEKFTKNNKIACTDKNLEKDLNNIIENIPELRTAIGRTQHKVHDFDVFQHSLKVLKKVNENPNYQKLNSSDKKIMNLAALMHDITKAEAQIDHNHTINGSIDGYFISKRFNLSNSEENKLYKIIKNHEWLKYINESYSDPYTTERRINNIAWELKEDNLLDMLKIFTYADLESIKKDNSFEYNKTSIPINIFKSKKITFAESVEIRANEIEKKIIELQNSQPLTPMTRIPKANVIKEAITEIKPDGSTNIKGVYVDKDGLVILMFNQIEDWEKIGFPNGSSTKGILIQTKNNQTVETGNIKFLAHGLDNETSLAKFNAIKLPDNNALLSVTYAERPETKYKFFRPQGILGYTDTYNVVGGGTSDVGSGCKKTLRKFINVVCNNNNVPQRVYISNEIKKALNLTDAEYRDFVKANKNKPYTSINPTETRNKIISKLGLMKSETRRFAREYNEFFASNVEPTATFAYNIDPNKKIENPIEFLNRTEMSEVERKAKNKYNIDSVRERTSYLRRFALQNNLPFVIFGE